MDITRKRLCDAKFLGLGGGYCQHCGTFVRLIGSGGPIRCAIQPVGQSVSVDGTPAGGTGEVSPTPYTPRLAIFS